MYLCLCGNLMAILNRFAFTPIVKRGVFLSFQKKISTIIQGIQVEFYAMVGIVKIPTVAIASENDTDHHHRPYFVIIDF